MSRFVHCATLLLLTNGLLGCAIPIHPDSMLIKEVQAAPGELIIRCEPPLASAQNVDKKRIARKDGVVSVRLYSHLVGFSGPPVALDPMRIQLMEGDHSVVFTDGTANREIWNASKGVLEFESGFYHPPPWRSAPHSDHPSNE